MRFRHSIAMLTIAGLSLGAGVSAAGAQSIPANQERFHLDTDTNVTDSDDFLVDVRVLSRDDDGDVTGIRSRSSSSDVEDLEDVRTDNRAVSSGGGSDAAAVRAIAGSDDLLSPDELETDVDAVTIEVEERESGSRPAAGQENNSPHDEDQYQEDVGFVFGPSA